MSESPKKSRGRPKKISDQAQYNLSITMGDFNFEVMTDDIKASILAIKPVKVMQRVVFKLSGEGKSTEQMLFPIRAKRIFFNAMAAEFFVKRLLLSMK